MQQHDQNTLKYHTHKQQILIYIFFKLFLIESELQINLCPKLYCVILNIVILSSLHIHDHNNHIMIENNTKQTHNQSTIDTNIIQKLNILNQGINYIVPAFWYQELIDINHKISQLSNIKYPSIETYSNFLTICDLKKPSQSGFLTKQRFPKQSALYETNLLDESNYISSKTLCFSKINNFINRNEIQWNVINPFIWDLILKKFQLKQQQKLQPNNIESQTQINKKITSRLNQYEKIPQIAVFFTKQFILQKGKCQIKQTSNRKNTQNIFFLYKNVKYLILRTSVNQQITNQLIKMTQKQINVTLIIDQSLKKYNLFRKICIQGFFAQYLPFKQVLKNIIETQSLKRVQNIDKFYIYDQFGEKLTHKISNVANFVNISLKKTFILCTSPLNQIINCHSSLKNNLVSMLEKDFKYPDNQSQNIKEQKNSNEQINLINQMKFFFENLSRQNQIHFLIQQIKKISDPSQRKVISIPSGFKPYNKECNDIKILSGTFYRSDESIKQEKNEQIRQNDEVRYLDSATTNLDTPIVDFQNQSEQICQSNYSNRRLHRHSNYSRAQRKKKAQSFLLKKKKSNYIIRSSGNIQHSHLQNCSYDYKKRIKHSLFMSLVSLSNDQQVLDQLIENMRQIALDSINNQESQLIYHPYPKNIENKNSSNFQYSFDGTDTKINLQKNSFNEYNSVQIERIQHIRGMQQSLLRISQSISRIYDPNINYEKGTQQQKCEYKFGLDKIYCDYEQLMLMKKDNEQIKTIIDNSECPYSQLQKNISIKYRLSQKQQKINIQNEYNYMIDGINQLEQDNDDQTI